MRYRRALSLSLCILASACSASSSRAASSLPLSSSRYDDAIRSAVRRDWADFPDWLYWKAQLYQESRFDPGARSPVGAAGLAQFMPGTWADVSRELGWSGVSANQADLAIEAGAYYMRKLRRSWKSPRPELERHLLGAASYNAGAGNVIRAQAACGGARDWAEISPCLRSVTGNSAAETITYVDRIQVWRRQLEGH